MILSAINHPCSALISVNQRCESHRKEQIPKINEDTYIFWKSYQEILIPWGPDPKLRIVEEMLEDQRIFFHLFSASISSIDSWVLAHLLQLFIIWGFPHSSDSRESVCNAGDPSSIPGQGRSPGEGIGYLLQYSWASVVAQLVKNPPAMWETWVQSLGWKDPLEKGKATHSSMLAWRISWTAQRVGHH